MEYSKALDFVDAYFVSFQTAGRGAYREGLEAIGLMMKHLGNPQRDFSVIHVAGTNGKGSVCHILASVLQAAGYRTGLFTSPHLHEFRERMRIDGEMIPERQVAGFIDRNGAKMKDLGLSYFEMTVAMAFDWFSGSNVEVAVVETGLGGRLDATNIVMPDLSVITNIGLEHTEILGLTLAEIAAEKGGIIKPEVPVVIGERNSLTDSTFECIARERGSEIIFAEDHYRIIDSSCGESFCSYTVQRFKDGRTQDLVLDLTGSYQARNLITVRGAVHAIRHLTNIDISSRALVEGCRGAAASTGLTGRWQVIGRQPLTICDTGHNAHGLKYITDQLKELLGDDSGGRSGEKPGGEPIEKFGKDEWQLERHVMEQPAGLQRAEVGHAAGLHIEETRIGEDRTTDAYSAAYGRWPGKLYIVLGLSNDKDLAEILPLFPADARYIFTQAASPRALPAVELAAKASGYGLEGEIVPGVPDALARARELALPSDVIFIGGSSFVVAEVI